MSNDLFTKPKRNTLSPAKNKQKPSAESSKDVSDAATKALQRRRGVIV